MAHSSQCSRTKNHTQTIEGEYLDPQKLMLLLRAVYGTSEGMNNFRVEVGHLRRNYILLWGWQHSKIAQVKSVPNLSLTRCDQCSRPYWSMMPSKVMRRRLIFHRRRSRIVERVEEDGFRITWPTQSTISCTDPPRPPVSCCLIYWRRWMVTLPLSGRCSLKETGSTHTFNWMWKPGNML